jgi:hypothetical protein
MASTAGFADSRRSPGLPKLPQSTQKPSIDPGRSNGGSCPKAVIQGSVANRRSGGKQSSMLSCSRLPSRPVGLEIFSSRAARSTDHVAIAWSVPQRRCKNRSQGANSTLSANNPIATMTIMIPMTCSIAFSSRP